MPCVKNPCFAGRSAFVMISAKLSVESPGVKVSAGVELHIDVLVPAFPVSGCLDVFLMRHWRQCGRGEEIRVFRRCPCEGPGVYSG